MIPIFTPNQIGQDPQDKVVFCLVLGQVCQHAILKFSRIIKMDDFHVQLLKPCHPDAAYNYHNTLN
jgi:hypothetical protein